MAIAHYLSHAIGYIELCMLDDAWEELEMAEIDAKDQKRGLWADPHAVAPWEWRRKGK